MAENLLLMLAAFGLSWGTYQAYENPLRHARALRRPQRALALWPVSVGAVAVAGALAASSLTSYPTVAPRLALGPTPAQAVAVPSPAAAPPVPLSERLTRAVAAAVAPAALDDPIPRGLAPPVTRLTDDLFPLAGCVAGDPPYPLCWMGDPHADRLLIVLGDSHARMWMSGVLRFAADRHWRVIPLIKHGCESFRLRSGACGAWYGWALAQIRQRHPDAILVGHFWTGWGLISIDATRRELRDLRPLAPRVAMLQDVPNRPVRSVDCLLRPGATRGSCTFPITSVQRSISTGVRAEVVRAGARYVRTLQWVCAAGRCPTVVGNVIIYRDKSHLSQTYERILAPALAVRIAAALSG